MSTRPFPRHQVSTRFLYVPAEDWPRVRLGEKTEFRTRPREGSNLLTCALPTPVVAYSRRMNGDVSSHSTKLMVLTHRSLEPLFNISENPEALAREGFESYDDFRRYWRARNGGRDNNRFQPMQRVYAWRVRPFEAWLDHETLGVALLTELYGEHLATA